MLMVHQIIFRCCLSKQILLLYLATHAVFSEVFRFSSMILVLTTARLYVHKAMYTRGSFPSVFTIAKMNTISNIKILIASKYVEKSGGFRNHSE